METTDTVLLLSEMCSSLSCMPRLSWEDFCFHSFFLYIVLVLYNLILQDLPYSAPSKDTVKGKRHKWLCPIESIHRIYLKPCKLLYTDYLVTGICPSRMEKERYRFAVSLYPDPGHYPGCRNSNFQSVFKARDTPPTPPPYQNQIPKN